VANHRRAHQQQRSEVLIATGPHRAISPNQLQQALGPEIVVGAFAAKLACSRHDLL
jgi:uncharacterized protein YidB (DUF937 family)